MSKLPILITLLLSTSLAHAQSQSHLDAAKELMDLMNADQAIDQVYDQMMAQMSGLADQLGVTEEQRPRFERHMQKMNEIMREELSWAKMEPHMIDVYVSVYTEDELHELNEFYASPLGQKFIAKMPELMEASMAMSQEMMQSMIPRLMEAQKELAADIQQSKEGAQ